MVHVTTTACLFSCKLFYLLNYLPVKIPLKSVQISENSRNKNLKIFTYFFYLVYISNASEKLYRLELNTILFIFVDHFGSNYEELTFSWAMLVLTYLPKQNDYLREKYLILDERNSCSVLLSYENFVKVKLSSYDVKPINNLTVLLQLLVRISKFLLVLVSMLVC